MKVRGGGVPISQAIRFARWLKEARIAAKLTQEQVAEYLDLSQPAYSEWEQKGRQWMEPEQVKKLASILHRSGADVAAALGYPVYPAEGASGVSPPPRPDDDTPQDLLQQMAQLDQRLARLEERERVPEPPDTEEDIAS